jgi:hypothetical protein
VLQLGAVRGGRVGPIVQDLARNYGTSQFEYDYIATVGMHTWDRPELKKRYVFQGVEDGFSLSRPGQPDWHGRIMWSSREAELLRLQATVERIELDRGFLKSTGNEELPLKRSGS